MLGVCLFAASTARPGRVVLAHDDQHQVVDVAGRQIVDNVHPGDGSSAVCASANTMPYSRARAGAGRGPGSRRRCLPGAAAPQRGCPAVRHRTPRSSLSGSFAPPVQLKTISVRTHCQGRPIRSCSEVPRVFADAKRSFESRGVIRHVTETRLPSPKTVLRWGLSGCVARFHPDRIAPAHHLHQRVWSAHSHQTNEPATPAMLSSESQSRS